MPAILLAALVLSGCDPTSKESSPRSSSAPALDALDPTRVPYIILPIGYRGANMGDLALVEYRGRKAWAVCGDRGNRFGEGSVKLAEMLGIPSDGISGGAGGGVTYTIFPRSGLRRPTEGQLLAEMREAGPALYARYQASRNARFASL